MKTIQQIAEEIGVSKATVYNRLKACQIKLTDLTGKKVKNKRLFDEEAEAIIKGIFVQHSSNDSDESKLSYTDRQYEETVKRLDKELDETRKELQEAREEIARLRTIEEQLHKQISDLIETQRADKLMLLQQQTSRKLLEEPKSGLLTRAKEFIFGRK